jgi:hypothetical protein
MAAQQTTVAFRVLSGTKSSRQSKSARTDSSQAIGRDIQGAFNILLKAWTHTATSDVRVSFQIVPQTENSGIS